MSKLEGHPAVQIELPFPDIPAWEVQRIDASISRQFHALFRERPEHRRFPETASQDIHSTNSIYKSLAEKKK